MNGVEDPQAAPDVTPPAPDETPAASDGAAHAEPVADAAGNAPDAPALPDEERETVPATPEIPAPSGRWLVIQASALLRAVATQNYVCYGTAGVPKYGVDKTSPAQSPAALNVALALRSAQGDIRLRCDGLRLASVRFTDRETVWGGFDAAQQLQVLWVWDFYRIQSHVALRVALPAGDGPPPDAWRAALDALRAAQVSDTLTLDVTSACGDFEQTHTLARRAVEWAKGS